MQNLYFKQLLTALLLLCATVATAHDFEVGGIYYNITSTTDFTVEVTYRGNSSGSYSNEYSGNVVIPESVTYNGSTYSVTSIGEEAFYGCSGLTGVEIPNSVTSIGGAAFWGCSGLKEVHISDLSAWCGIDFDDSLANPLFYAHNLYLNGELVTDLVIPDGVTEIKGYAFYECSGLTSVVIPNSVTSIGKGAFEYCSGLTSVEIPNSVTSIGGAVFYGCSGLKEVHISDLSAWCGIDFYNEIANPLYYAHNLYLNDELVTDLVIPDGVTEIKRYAFRYCSGLTSVVIPNSVTSIGEYAFEYCSGLTSVVIPNSVTSIGGFAFYECSGLTSVVIPNSVTSIGKWAFSSCSGLTGVVIPNSVTSIGSYAFRDCSGLTSVVIPNSVTSIGSYAFYGCSALTSVEIPNSVTSIGSYAFYKCSGLSSIEIPNSVTSISSYAFYGCSGLKEVHISDLFAWCGIEFDDYYANPLYYAHNLYLNGELVTDLVIPDGVTEIKGYAFFGCSSLTSVVIPNSVTSIGDSAFYNYTGLTSVVIPAFVTSIGSYASRGCSGLKSVVIPNSVTSIGERAFYNCSGLTSVVIPNSVTSIGERAFYNCSGLKKVINCSSLTFSKGSTANGYVAYYADTVINAPNGSVEGDFVFAVIDGVNTLCFYIGAGGDVTLPADYKGENYVIGANVFNNNTSLTGVVIPNSVTRIGMCAFDGCSGLTSVVVGNSVTSIGEWAFYNCRSLTSVVIPASVTSIGENAFRDCRGLTGITSMIPAEDLFSVTNYTFDYNCVLYVPKGAKETYASTGGWSKFKNIVETDFTGIDEVKGENGKVEGVYYDLNGRAVERPANGLYIKNGKKVFVK